MNAAAQSDPGNWPGMLPGFDHVSRIWDASNRLCAARVLPGEHYVTRNHEIITTVLGSCISACIRDPDSGVGGMNHFILPGNTAANTSKWGRMDCVDTRYGVAAMEVLINDILKQGSRRNRLELKLFGGGEVLQMNTSNVGSRNIEFAREFAQREELTIVSEDLGGQYPRKINYFPRSGKVMVKRLRSLQRRAIVSQEIEYESTLGAGK